jgi:glycosyltransferase involved in cell wall biosynthesis
MEMKMTLCSTIIPTVNRPTLEHSVMSALNQDLGPELHEILVFNNSKGFLTESDWMSSPQVKIINTHSNLIHASNLGAEMATGKYINFLHDDDYLHSGALKSLVDAAEESGCDWVYGAYHLVDDEGSHVSTERPQINGNIFAFVLSGECLHFANSMINRKAFLNVGMLDPQIRAASDLDLECRMALVGDFKSIDDVVATVRIAGGKGSTIDTSSVSKDHRRLRENVLDSPNALKRLLDSINSDVFLRGRVSRVYLFSSVWNILNGHLAVAGKRLISLLYLAKFYPLLPDFWRGLFYRSYWYSVGKSLQLRHFKTHFPS